MISFESTYKCKPSIACRCYLVIDSDFQVYCSLYVWRASYPMDHRILWISKATTSFRINLVVLLTMAYSKRRLFRITSQGLGKPDNETKRPRAIPMRCQVNTYGLCHHPLARVVGSSANFPSFHGRLWAPKQRRVLHSSCFHLTKTTPDGSKLMNLDEHW